MGNTIRKKFVCRHCNQTVNIEGKMFIHEGEHLNIADMGQGLNIESYMCNLCGGMNLFVTTKHYSKNSMEEIAQNIKGKTSNLHVFPVHNAPKKIKYVPAEYLSEYNDARILIDINFRACALLCRRIMESVLIKACELDDYHLSTKIKSFNDKYNPPELVKKSMKYIIDAGNASAHDNVNINDDLIKISRTDCEELLNAVELIFDVVFVQPRKALELEKKLKRIEEKPKNSIKAVTK